MMTSLLLHFLSGCSNTTCHTVNMSSGRTSPLEDTQFPLQLETTTQTSSCDSVEPTDDWQQKPAAETSSRPAPPTSLPLCGPMKRKVLAAPALSVSLQGDSAHSPSPSLSPDEEGDQLQLDDLETPSDSESLHVAVHGLDLGVRDELRRLGVSSRHPAPFRRGLTPSLPSPAPSLSGPAPLGQEDAVDQQGTRWRCFSSGQRVNMSLLEPFVRVLSHGGYCQDGVDDIIVFSSCYLPDTHLDDYQLIMENLFQFLVATLDLMVSENYTIVFFCADGNKDKLPRISWLRECYTTINHRLRKNLKRLFVVHPNFYIRALITIIRPFISSKFSRKLQFVSSLQDLSQLIPTEQVQIPHCVSQFDQSLTS